MPRKKLPPSNELAQLVIRDEFMNEFGEVILRYWLLQWWRHGGKAFRRLESIPLELVVRDWVRRTIGPNYVTSGLIRSIIAELRLAPFVYVPDSWDMPCVLPSDIPHLDERHELVRPTNWINLDNGIFDLEAWEAGREPLLRHTATFFCVDCTEYGWS